MHNLSINTEPVQTRDELRKFYRLADSLSLDEIIKVLGKFQHSVANLPTGSKERIMQPDMNQLFQSMQKMQQEVVKIQGELQQTTLEGKAGGGAVTITCNGAMEFLSVKIKPEAIDPEDPGTLEDLILVAVNDAMAQCQKLAQDKMGKSLGMPGGLPPGMGGY